MLSYPIISQMSIYSSNLIISFNHSMFLALSHLSSLLISSPTLSYLILCFVCSPLSLSVSLSVSYLICHPIFFAYLIYKTRPGNCLPDRAKAGSSPNWILSWPAGTYPPTSKESFADNLLLEQLPHPIQDGCRR